MTDHDQTRRFPAAVVRDQSAAEREAVGIPVPPG